MGGVGESLPIRVWDVEKKCLVHVSALRLDPVLGEENKPVIRADVADLHVICSCLTELLKQHSSTCASNSLAELSAEEESMSGVRDSEPFKSSSSFMPFCII
ncbi:hypothetical protein AB1Y20_017025 [Prymnesium parvum]|uniref:Centrosomal protein of 19 kDa n=1 Tax=Prymnesium parvum TaxID=97485 RepID=A0AB34I7Q0_PRYPA|mmetsp:Transcript_4477/g.11149  ORF Transcript_4477/g.11149 Transcript_4477/m.11149 type:complete len:102 (+) Transcript_4477:470-775(+)